jgi:hypothetical protein
LFNKFNTIKKKRECDKIEYPFVINFYNPNIINAQSITGPNRFFIDHLLEIPSNETNKNLLIFLCKEKYQNNDTESRIIQEFPHTYSSTRSLSCTW